mmetsp:Transcript_4838/g.14655  ORF Transcript_4838/g.14655 Transcript_4838/m.14655 type:complete len:986 (+) Transcript_4838:202-3159(+)
MAEEDEEEDDAEKMAAARLRLEEEDRGMKSEMERQDRRRNQESLFRGGDADVANVVRSLHERYQRTTQLAQDLDDFDEGIPFGDSARTSLAASRHAATRQANAPSLTDPRLWVVPCKSGYEREAVVSLMNKFIAMVSAGHPMRICGAMSTGLRGFIYVESRSEPEVHVAVKGLRLLRGWSMRMVPMTDMVAVVSTDVDAPCGSGTKYRGLRVGDWARVSREKYQGDLCRIVALGNGASSAVIMLVPRFDVFSDTTGSADAVVGASGKMRPAMRLFNASEVIAAGGAVIQRKFRFNENAGAASRGWTLSDETFDVYENGSYLRGFLYKEINVATMLKPGDADPTLDELQRFVIETQEPKQPEGSKQEQDFEFKSSLNAQIESLARGGENKNRSKIAAFARDDKVEAIDGEMQGIVFVVERVEASGIVSCRAVDEPRLQGASIPIESQRLLKCISVGSHVKVEDGKFAGQTGVVLERGVLDDDHVAVILTDCGGREITVRLAHVQESSEISSGLDALKGYELHDLVLLPLGTVGVITYVSSDDLEVLTSRGELRNVRPAEIARKLNQESGRSVSLDSKDEHVRETDLVVLDDGQAAGVLATVVRIHRASLWLLNVASGAALAPRGGLFVKKSREVHVAGDRASGTVLADAYMGLGKQRVVNEDQFNNRAANGRSARDPMVGRTVRICKGNYKGLAGIVTNATSTHVTVELHTRNRSVTQPRENIKFLSGTAGGDLELDVQRRIAGSGAHNTDPLSTPFLTQATPILGGATPQYGAVTPHHSTPSQSTTTPTRSIPTPAYGSHTPHHYGSFTPARANATPNHSQSGAEDVWRPRVLATPRNIGRSPLQSAMSPNSFSHRSKSPSLSGVYSGTPISATLPSASRSEVWCVSGCEAKLQDGKICKITHADVQKSIVTVALKETPASTRTVPVSALVRVEPKAGDKVRVVDGDNVYDAELLSIEDSDGIIKVDNGEYKIIDFSAIAKIAAF